MRRAAVHDLDCHLRRISRGGNFHLAIGTMGGEFVMYFYRHTAQVCVSKL